MRRFYTRLTQYCADVAESGVNHPQTPPMKPLSSFTALAALYLGAVLPLPAQTDASKPDPFLKSKQAAASPAPKNSDQASNNILFTFETFVVPQADYLQLIESGTSSVELYKKLTEAAKAGTVSLENLLGISTRAGQRATVEQVDEVRHAIEFSPPQPKGGFPYPTVFEVRGVGDRLEIDPATEEEGKTVALNYALSADRLASFTEFRSDPSTLEGSQIQAIFETRRATSAVSLKNGTPLFVGTLGRASDNGVEDAEAPGTTRVIFAKSRAVSFSGDAAAKPVVAHDAPLLRITASFYSMERGTAQTILGATANGDVLHADVLNQVKAGSATLERMLTCVTRSGQRTTCDEVHEIRYPTGFDFGGTEVDSKKQRPAPSGTGFEVRPTGWRMEVDPVLADDGVSVEVNVAPEFVRYCGMLKGNDFMEKHYPPQPVFENHKLMTSVGLPAGHHALLGTFSPPRDSNVNGRPDDGKVWLAFLRVDVE